MEHSINTSTEKSLEIEHNVVISQQFAGVTSVKAFLDDNKTRRK